MLLEYVYLQFGISQVKFVFLLNLTQSATAETCKPVLIVGNKCDLENDRVISYEEGQAVAEELGRGKIGHHETSAKSNINVGNVRIRTYCIKFIQKSRLGVD